MGGRKDEGPTERLCGKCHSAKHGINEVDSSPSFSTKWRLKGCIKCGGDMFKGLGEFECIQCGTAVSDAS